MAQTMERGSNMGCIDHKVEFYTESCVNTTEFRQLLVGCIDFGKLSQELGCGVKIADSSSAIWGQDSH